VPNFTTNILIGISLSHWTYTYILQQTYTQWRKKNAFFFQIIVTFFISNIKNYVNTKTTCNKCSFDYLHWLLNCGKLYPKDGVLLAVYTSRASPQSSASHLLTFLMAQLQFLREWKLSDRRLYEVSERRLLIWGNPKERNSPNYYPFQKPAFFLRHPVQENNAVFSQTVFCRTLLGAPWR